MIKNRLETVALALLAAIAWLGVGVQQGTDGGYELAVSPAVHAREGNKGDKGDRAGDRGNRDSGNRDKSANSGNNPGNQGVAAQSKPAEPAAAVKPYNVVDELKDLISLNRNIRALLNSSDPKMEPFRNLFINEDGSLREFSEDATLEDLLSDDELSEILQAHYGYPVSDSLLVDIKFILKKQLREYKAVYPAVSSGQ